MIKSIYRRIEKLTDSFEEFFPDTASSTVSGVGVVEGKTVYISGTDTEPSGPVDLYQTLKEKVSIMEKVLKEKKPLILISDAPKHTTKGSPIPPDGSKLLTDKEAGMGHFYHQHAILSGRVPKLCACFGMNGASTSFPVALCDIVIMTKDAGLCIGRPDAVKKMVGEDIDAQTLGGASIQCAVTGTGDIIVEDEDAAISKLKELIRLIPSHFEDWPPCFAPQEPEAPEIDINELIPEDPDRPFNIKELIKYIVDEDSFLEVKETYAKESCTAFARINGLPFGIVANNSINSGGILFTETCRKMSHFVSLCDAFNFPILFLADTPGFMIGSRSERSGMVKAGAMLFSTIANTITPKLCVVAKKAHSAGLYAMSGPGMGPENFLALSGAVISIYGPTALKRLAANDNLGVKSEIAVREMLNESLHPELLEEKGLIDKVISVEDLRKHVASFLKKALTEKREKYPRPVIRT